MTPTPGPKKARRAAADARVGKRARPGTQPQNSGPGEQYFLIKSEPESRVDPKTKTDMKFGIDDLVACQNKTSLWDGVRNYEARNIMKSMRLNDKALFYHSNCKKPGVIGTVEIVREHYPDPTQFDATDAHFDPKSKEEDPRWVAVDVKFLTKFPRLVGLDEIKTHSELQDMFLVQRGRLSVQPVDKDAFNCIVNLGLADIV